ncbi:MAG: hypothetical protein EOP84_21600 [Verrucomicrobiaceae bacterium]|nr:MAG: hypothetical protein EOP84_21600 [Verrucomicrobiaceae bacterium]
MRIGLADMIPTMLMAGTAFGQVGPADLAGNWQADSGQMTGEGAKCHIPGNSGLQEGWASKHFVQEGTMFVGFQNFC